MGITWNDKAIQEYKHLSQDKLIELQLISSPGSPEFVAASVLLNKCHKHEEAKNWRLAIGSFVVALLALVVAILVWIFPHEPRDTGRSSEQHSPALPVSSPPKP